MKVKAETERVRGKVVDRRWWVVGRRKARRRSLAPESRSPSPESRKAEGGSRVHCPDLGKLRGEAFPGAEDTI